MIANLNQIGSAGPGLYPHKNYLKECLMQDIKTAGLVRWNFKSDKCEILERVSLKEKVTKNKNSTPFLRIKSSFEGTAAKIIPMSQGKDVIYFVMGGYDKSTREGSDQNYWVNLRTGFTCHR